MNFSNKQPDPMRLIVIISQLFIVPLFLLLRLLFVRSRQTEAVRNFQKEKNMKYVIYANHQSKLDSILICLSLPLPIFISLLPFRFMTANQFFKPLLSRVVLTALGCYYAYELPNQLYGLEKSRFLLERNQAVVIFPQGKRTREKIAKRGISVLAQEKPVTLIPIHLQWKGRFSCSIHIGEPFNPKSTASADDLMEKLYQLPV